MADTDFYQYGSQSHGCADLLDQLKVEEMVNLVKLGGFQTVAVDSVGKVAAMDSDGLVENKLDTV